MEDVYICFHPTGKVKKHPDRASIPLWPRAPMPTHLNSIDAYFSEHPECRFLVRITAKTGGPLIDVWLKAEGQRWIVQYLATAGTTRQIMSFEYKLNLADQNSDYLWWARERAVGIIREAYKLYYRFFPEGGTNAWTKEKV